MQQKFSGQGVWGPGFTEAIYSAASSEAVNGSRPVSVSSPGCYYVSCHHGGIQVSFTTHALHALLRLDLDDRILWYSSTKVCAASLGEPL